MNIYLMLKNSLEISFGVHRGFTKDPTYFARSPFSIAQLYPIICIVSISNVLFQKKPWVGFGPTTFALPRQRSSQAELPRHFIIKKISS